MKTLTAYELAELVDRMRDAQKAYFKTRSQRNLEDAKRLEKEVDTEIIKIRATAKL